MRKNNKLLKKKKIIGQSKPNKLVDRSKSKLKKETFPNDLFLSFLKIKNVPFGYSDSI